MHYLKDMLNRGEGRASVKRSFTLVETLVAISIIMVVIIGPFHTVQTALNASYTARDQLIANSLAQEGVEYVRSIRDSDYLYNRANPSSTQVSFLAGINGNSNVPAGSLNSDCVANNCVVDPAPASGAGSVSVCSGTCTPLYVNTSTNVYNQNSSGLQSKFTRSVRLCYINSSGVCAASGTLTNEAKLVVTVSWTTAGQVGSVVLTDYLQNWL